MQQEEQKPVEQEIHSRQCDKKDENAGKKLYITHPLEVQCK